MSKKPTKAQLDAAVAEIEAGLAPDQIGEVRRGPGRPPLSTSGRGASPTLTARIGHDLRRRLDAYVEASGARQSDVVREALIEYLDEHHASA